MYLPRSHGYQIFISLKRVILGFKYECLVTWCLIDSNPKRIETNVMTHLQKEISPNLIIHVFWVNFHYTSSSSISTKIVPEYFLYDEGHLKITGQNREKQSILSYSNTVLKIWYFFKSSFENGLSWNMWSIVTHLGK